MKEYSGVFTALITPFKNGAIDEIALKKLIEWNMSFDVKGIVLCGSTGEAHTLCLAEQLKMLDIANDINKGEKKVIAGASSACTADCIKRIKLCTPFVDAALVAAPYYNKPTQEGIYLHFKAIYEETNFPVIVYDVPSRCSVGIDDETMLKVMELPNIVAIKDATGSVTRPLTLKNKKISLLSGDDITALAYYVYGGDGVISVTSNILPQLCAKLYRESIAGNIANAIALNNSLFSINKALFNEANPIPIKYALSMIKDYIMPEYRLPLTQPTNKTKDLIDNELNYLKANAPILV